MSERVHREDVACLTAPSTVTVVVMTYCGPVLMPRELAGIDLDVELSTVWKGPWPK